MKLVGYDNWTKTWNSQICIAHLAWSSSNGILTHRSTMYPMHAFGSSTYYLCPLQNKSQKSEILYRSFVKNLQMIIMKIIKLVVSRPAPRNKMIVKKSRGLCKNEQSYSQNSRVYLNKYYNSSIAILWLYLCIPMRQRTLTGISNESDNPSDCCKLRDSYCVILSCRFQVLPSSLTYCDFFFLILYLRCI